ncbi:MAG: DUF1569 domain-containing protein [Kangiellaceae bacterium]|nr:DUF1569 domain-containing protein [Kangiellaceae bacterium]MCW9015710.1 DUF1569 domain-containing protein [Kangiellaceae bacterium]
MDHKRRQLIKKIGLYGIGVSVPIGGLWWLNGEPNFTKLNFSETLEILDILKVSQVSSSGRWDVPTILAHITQSIELSIEGYPEHKSDLFKSTVGATAFKAFARTGTMSHGLDEAIPGAETIPKGLAVNTSIAKLELAIARFKAHQGGLQPHFAYGELTKSEYELAHVLHFMNHMQEVHIITK